MLGHSDGLICALAKERQAEIRRESAHYRLIQELRAARSAGVPPRLGGLLGRLGIALWIAVRGQDTKAASVRDVPAPLADEP